MKQIALAHFNQLYLTCGALIIFFALFVSALIWVYRPSGKKTYQSISQFPLEELPKC